MNQDYNKNITLSYEYVEKSLKEIQDIINNRNTQLGLIIGFNFTFIRFFINELPRNRIDDNLIYYSSVTLQIFSYLFAFSSILFCFLGLYKNVDLLIISPDKLVNVSGFLSEIDLREAILDTWNDKLEKLIEINEQKKKILNRSIICLVFSGLMVIFDRLINAVFIS